MKLMSATCLAVAAMSCPLPARGTTIHVPADQPTIQAGLAAAAFSDTVLVKCGIYYEDHLELRAGVHLLSETGEMDCVVIDAQGSSNVMFGYWGGDEWYEPRSMEGFTLTGAVGHGYGTGLYCGSGYYEFRNVRICKNRNVDYGGAVHFDGEPYYGQLTMHSCLIDSNSVRGLGVDGGGAGLTCVQGTATLVECVFKDNAALKDVEWANIGGGVRTIGCAATFTRCGFIGNHVEGYGGGISCESGSNLLEDCWFIGNSADWGGAIAVINGGGLTRVRGCTIVGNSADQGAGIYGSSYGSHTVMLEVIGCTLAGNLADSYGGGLNLKTGALGSIAQSVLWGNCALNGSQLAILDPTASVTIGCSDYESTGGWYDGPEGAVVIGADVVSEDPLFCDPVDCHEAPTLAGEYSLASGSPCLPEENACGTLMGAKGQGCEQPTAAPYGLEPAILETSAFPNPFNPGTEIRSRISQPALVTLRILAVDGRCVRRLFEDAFHPSGEVRAVWDGQDEAGRPLPSGMYIYELTAGEESATGKLVLLR